MDEHGLIDMPLKWGPFTWSNKRTEGDSILEKINIILFNLAWNSLFNKALGIIEPAIISDHSPLVLLLTGMHKKFKRDFKFESKWLLEDDCKELIKNEWVSTSSGHQSTNLHRKLLRSRRKLLYSHGAKIAMEVETPSRKT
ncbi:hypothetical protein V6N11_059577 [Hibiscus sabdariffa]|uniref:Reverse transcriptase n=1 Tax=Hibiscus sabdariffa TaxID=183260 RepID=A0ABR2NP81_9ROSI